MAFIKCVVSFFRVGESASFERFCSRMPVEECNDNLSKFKKTASEVLGWRRLAKGTVWVTLSWNYLDYQSCLKESYAIQTQFQWNTERDPLTSDSDQNDLNIILPIYILYRNVTDLVSFLLITDFSPQFYWLLVVCGFQGTPLRPS